MGKYLLKIIKMDKGDVEKRRCEILCKYLRRTKWSIIWLEGCYPGMYDVLNIKSEQWLILQRCGYKESALDQFGKPGDPLRENVKTYKLTPYSTKDLLKIDGAVGGEEIIYLQDGLMYNIKEIKK